MRLAGGIGEAADAGDEALAVGVLADQPAVAGDHAIDRTHQRRGIAEAVQVGDDRELVRDGAVEAAKAHGARAGDGRGEVGGGDLDGEIAPVQAVMAEGGLDHGLGRVLGHGLAEAADQLLLEVEWLGHGGAPQRRATARRSPRPASSTARVGPGALGRAGDGAVGAGGQQQLDGAVESGGVEPAGGAVGETVDLVHAPDLGLLLQGLQGIVLLHDAHRLDRVRARPFPAALGGVEEGGQAPDPVGDRRGRSRAPRSRPRAVPAPMAREREDGQLGGRNAGVGELRAPRRSSWRRCSRHVRSSSRAASWS